jgi:hypothetical protein
MQCNSAKAPVPAEIIAELTADELIRRTLHRLLAIYNLQKWMEQ